MVRETMLSEHTRKPPIALKPVKAMTFSRHSSQENFEEDDEKLTTSAQDIKTKYGKVLHGKIASTLATILLERALANKDGNNS